MPANLPNPSDCDARHTTLVSVAALLIKALEHYGLDYLSIIADAGINTQRPYRPTDRLPVRNLQQVWRLAVHYSGDPCFGLTYAQYIQPAALHGLGLAWLASDSLKDGLNRLIRFQKVISTAFDIRLVESPSHYELRLSQDSETRNHEPASIDAALASFLRMCQLTAGPQIYPKAVHITHADYGCAERFERYFGTPVTFESSSNCLVFDKAALDKKLFSANPELARINDEQVMAYLKHFDRGDIVTQVRAQLIEQLPNGLPQQQRIAEQLHLSLRNLQRKLQLAGTSYTSIIDETRKDLAIQYLTGSERSILEIGFLLGFTESTNFTRAFRRWTGHTPQHYRRS